MIDEDEYGPREKYVAMAIYFHEGFMSQHCFSARLARYLNIIRLFIYAMGFQPLSEADDAFRLELHANITCHIVNLKIRMTSELLFIKAALRTPCCHATIFYTIPAASRHIIMLIMRYYTC